MLADFASATKPHAKAHKGTLEAAKKNAVAREHETFLESKDNTTRVNRSTSAAAAMIKLPPNMRGLDVVKALSRKPSPLSEIMSIDEAVAHTKPGLLANVLQGALGADAELKALVVEPVQVNSCTNVQRLNRRDLADAQVTIAELLKTARSPAACAPGARVMGWLKYHAVDPARARPQGVATQHRAQSGHAELMAAAPSLAELMASLGDSWRVYTPGPPGAPRCLLIVVSRNCCSSCRYALPHIARLLKIDIVAYFRSSAGALQSPVHAAWDAEPPAAQLGFGP